MYGKGWASYHPEDTLKELGLKCEMLQVGDICISLTPRDSKPPTAPTKTHSASSMPAPPKSITGRSYDGNFSGPHGWSNSAMDRHEARKYASSAMAPPPPPSVPEQAHVLHRDDAFEMRSKKRRSMSIADNCDDAKKLKPNK